MSGGQRGWEGCCPAHHLCARTRPLSRLLSLRRGRMWGFPRKKGPGPYGKHPRSVPHDSRRNAPDPTGDPLSPHSNLDDASWQTTPGMAQSPARPRGRSSGRAAPSRPRPARADARGPRRTAPWHAALTRVATQEGWGAAATAASLLAASEPGPSSATAAPPPTPMPAAACLTPPRAASHSDTGGVAWALTDRRDVGAVASRLPARARHPRGFYRE